MKYLKQIHLQSLTLSWIAIGILVTSSARAATQPQAQQLPDTSRRWSVSAAMSGGYDDNLNSAPSYSNQRQHSATSTFSPKFYLNLPMDQSFIGMKYGYEGIYYWDRTGGDRVDQSHSVDLVGSHRFNPRLQLDVTDTFRRTYNPELVDMVANVPFLRQSQGNYIYNNLSGTLTYNLSRLWTLSLNNTWEYWSYDIAATADQEDRNMYSPLIALNYILSPSTTLGLNFRLGVVDYRNPGLGNAKNSTSENAFLSVTHLFNPQLSGNISLGGGVTELGDGHSTSSPYFSSGLSYRYSSKGSLNVGASYFLYTADTAGYRTSETLATYMQVSQAITPKLSSSLTLNYVYNVYANPDPTIAATTTLTEPATRAWIVTMGLSYGFTRWLSADLTYTFNLNGSDLPGSSYHRNRIGAGMRFTY